VTDREIISGVIEACQRLTGVVNELNKEVDALQKRVYAIEQRIMEKEKTGKC
jgi:Holliday junction resolvasome RuvABC endonuclease subunit